LLAHCSARPLRFRTKQAPGGRGGCHELTTGKKQGVGRHLELGGARVSAALSSKGGARVGKGGAGGCGCLNRRHGRTWEAPMTPRSSERAVAG